MRKSEVQQTILNELLETFYPNQEKLIDWMGFDITKKNKPTYHHIEKVADLRKMKKSDVATIRNGAILGKSSHEKLNKIEHLDHELYECWQYVFYVINNMGIYPIEDVWEMVYSLKEKTLTTLYQDNKRLELK